MGQVNFRTTDEVQAAWAKVKDSTDLKNDELFAEMVKAYGESRAAQMGDYAGKLGEIRETLSTAVSQMVAVLGQDEARRKASVLAVEAERDDAVRRAERLSEELEEARAALKAVEAERDVLRARADEADRLEGLSGELAAMRDALAKAMSSGVNDRSAGGAL